MEAMVWQVNSCLESHYDSVRHTCTWCKTVIAYQPSQMTCHTKGRQKSAWAVQIFVPPGNFSMLNIKQRHPSRAC